MLDAIPAETLHEWLTFREIEHDPILRLIDVVTRAAVLLLASQGVEVEPQDLDRWMEVQQGVLQRQAVGQLKQSAEDAERIASGAST